MIKAIRSKKGVTLVELLAVIVILGIIAAIAVPTIGTIISRQRTRASEASFSSIEEAARLFSMSELDNQFTLRDLDRAGYIDLSDTLISLTADGRGMPLEDIVITVTGSVVMIRYERSSRFPGADRTIFFNGIGIVLSTGNAV